MLDLWFPTVLMLCLAAAFIGLPLWRGYRATPQEDREALNVVAYQEHLVALEVQHAAGVLSAEQYAQAQAEAGRSLLADVAQPATQSTQLSRVYLLLGVLAVPLLALAMYLHWGASVQLAVVRAEAQPPANLEEWTLRLEQRVQVQPDASAWYTLGRAYMAQGRFSAAVEAFSEAAPLSERAPEVLGQLAQAQFFAGNSQWSSSIEQLAQEAVDKDPQETTSLGLLGIGAFDGARYAQAIAYWQRLLAVLPADDSGRVQIESGIAAAQERMLPASQTTQASSAAQAVGLRVQVTLAPALHGRVERQDSVFVFARAIGGPPMPLAVKRLTVADLPVTVTLSDADAMMPGLNLSSVAQVELVARISRAGVATAGQWIGKTPPIASTESQPQQIVIDTAEAP